ncbi:COP9 signalosome catalytic subunit rri1 [Cystobasidiomycetes sp. EMM_F5]
MDSNIAQKTFELHNDIKTVDSVYEYNGEAQRQLNKDRPWKGDPHYFKHVQISAVALVKMVTHARSGGQYEIMGLMQGKIEKETFVILDAFALPVLGTETRVNAGSEADEYMVQYKMTSEQHNNQSFQDPFLAIVIDPNRTISAGKVEIGAFRSYPENYTPPNAAPSEYQSIPLNKIEDFGVHSSRYYPLEISHFKSSLDTQLLELLWNKYWVMTLSQSPLVANRSYMTSQITDMTEKLGRTEANVQSRSSLAALAPEVVAARQGSSSNGKGKEKDVTSFENGQDVQPKEENAMTRVLKDSKKISTECHHGLINQILKDLLFNRSTVPIEMDAQGKPVSDENLGRAMQSAIA